VARATVTAGSTHARLSIKNVLRQAGLGSVALLVALGAGTEASMAGFTSTYLVAVGFTPAAATWALAAHWVGLIVGRLVFAGRVDRDKLRSIMVAALGSAAAILALVAPSWSPILAAAPFATGVAIAIIVPTTLALGGERYPRNAGTLFGMLLTVAQVGGITFPAILGVTAEAAGVRAAMLIAVINNLVIAGICLKAARPMHRRTGGATVEPRLPGD
jgi:fucose permease